MDEAEDVMRTVLRHWAEIEAPYAYARAAARRAICRVRTPTSRRREAELDRLLERATRSALAALSNRIDPAQRLLDLHAEEPPTDETGKAVP